MVLPLLSPTRRDSGLLNLLAGGGVLAVLLAVLTWDGLRDVVAALTGLSMARGEMLSLLALLAIAGLIAQLGRRIWTMIPHTRFSAEERRILRALPQALARGEIQPHFQPVVDADTGQVVAVEALARWIKADGSILPPGQFIGLAERAGLIRLLTKGIMEHAVRTAAAWRTHDLDIPISINLSVEDLEASDLVDHLIALCDRHGVPHAAIRVELTETQSIVHFDVVDRAVATLRQAGMAVYLDDFGTGYASLSVLHRIPFTGIKLDQSFIRRLRDDPRADAIVRASVAIARDLGLALVAEGVEDSETRDRLGQLGVSHIQGYVYARAMPAHDIVDFARQTQPALTLSL
ncbi:EAL domain-containing protein [Nitrospirillum iridis]|uniref:EAL domain-containing protein (Putative c-di-GMP-specific phosphodiesterase class I) n=1 Tax=Nitrospirillum iridis TaxID=765888 RepID=A0A7X0AXD4_9PROT|nr:EAL domain-containing protein [Nitrospirillum iridis]MBB6251868.1 EAL domain-containing protein (putative c-di-GMP-specific phosphodiesterase class I) [Nitrospirillum iridis]